MVSFNSGSFELGHGLCAAPYRHQVRNNSLGQWQRGGALPDEVLHHRAGCLRPGAGQNHTSARGVCPQCARLRSHRIRHCLCQLWNHFRRHRRCRLLKRTLNSLLKSYTVNDFKKVV